MGATLVIGHALVDVHQGELTVRLNDQQITFNVVNAMKCPPKLKTATQLNPLGGIITSKKC